MSESSKEMLVEVTSSASLPTTKKVIDTFLLECVRLGITQSPEITEGDQAPSNVLTVQQVKVLDSTGGFQAVYPSRTDLVFEEADYVRVVHNYN